METINSQEELIETLKDMKFKSLFNWFTSGEENKFLGIRVKAKTANDAKYGWTNYHSFLNYKGEKIAVKLPTIVGSYFAVYVRSVAERLFNDGFLVYEGPNETFQREAEIYTRLYNSGFPTFESRQEILNDRNGNPMLKGVLLTRKVEEQTHLVDLLSCVEPTQALDCLSGLSHLLNRLHTDYELIWGEPGPGNSMFAPGYSKNGKLLAFDFGLKPNPDISMCDLQGKDLVALCLSSVGRSGLSPEEVVPVMINSYQSKSRSFRFNGRFS